nr:FG-GAP repeat protein [Nitrospira sp.]
FGILDSSEPEDRFGLALAGGDFNGDTRSDLAIGVPNEDVGSIDSAGAVQVLYGVAQIGLSSTGDQFWTQNSFEGFIEIAEEAEDGDRFGASLAAGNFNNDSGGSDDLAIGVPSEDVQLTTVVEITDAGAVNVIYGSQSQGGLSVIDNQLWTQESPGIQDSAEEGDKFGSALAAGNFNGQAGSDLAIGVPREDVGNIVDAGAVNIIYGFTGVGLHNGNSSPRIVSQEDKFITQGTHNISEVPEEGDQFGSSLTMWNFGNGAPADLAIGVHLEDIGLLENAGAVHVLYGPGSSDENFIFVNQLWTQSVTGIADTVEAGDAFGAALY